jgi:hypothetical protein
MNFKLYRTAPQAKHYTKPKNVIAYILKHHVGETITFRQFRNLGIAWNGTAVPGIRRERGP